MTEPWISADEIASHLGVSKDTVYAWIGDVPLCGGVSRHRAGSASVIMPR